MIPSNGVSPFELHINKLQKGTGRRAFYEGWRIGSKLNSKRTKIFAEGYNQYMALQFDDLAKCGYINRVNINS